jgi:glutaredoxin
MAATLLVSGGVIAHRAVTSLADAAIAGEESTSLDATPARLATPSRAETPPVVVPPAVAAPAGAPLELAPPAAAVLPPEAPALPLPSRSAASASESRVASRRRQPTPAEFQAALSATPIVMYSASWCGVCRKARQFLTANGLRFQEIDADATPGAWDTIERLAGGRGVPLIIVDGEQTPQGLSPSSVMRAVSHSMERRLGITGIQFTPP